MNQSNEQMNNTGYETIDYDDLKKGDEILIGGVWHRLGASIAEDELFIETDGFLLYLGSCWSASAQCRRKIPVKPLEFEAKFFPEDGLLDATKLVWMHHYFIQFEGDMTYKLKGKRFRLTEVMEGE